MAKVWVFQAREDIAKWGEDKAAWYVGWYEPDGRRRKKSYGPGFLGHKRAEKEKHRLEEELLTGNYQTRTRKPWNEFRQEYETKVLARKAGATRTLTRLALDHFERLIKPIRVFGLRTEHMDEFITKRSTERGKKPGSLVSPCTVNKELRHIKAALAVALEWNYLAKLPKFRSVRELGKIPSYVTGDHFAVIYRTCDKAKKPGDIPNVRPVDWWQALLVTGYLTGWRIGDMLALRKDRLDLEAGTAFSRAEDNKGKRDELIKLHPVIIEHLRRLDGAQFTSPLVFPWNANRGSLYRQFARIQELAGIHLPCDEAHEHSRYCYVYGFHDLRRAFATYNADKLTPDALQKLMRHRSYQTTQKYINLARQMDAAVASLYVPEVLKNDVS
jgi:integrase